MHCVRCMFVVMSQSQSICTVLSLVSVMFGVLLSRLAPVFLRELGSYLGVRVVPVCLPNRLARLSPGLSNDFLLPPVSCRLYSE